MTDAVARRVGFHSAPDYISHHPQRVASMRSVIRVSLIQLRAATAVWMAAVCAFQFLSWNVVFSAGAQCACCRVMHVEISARAVEEIRRCVKDARWWRCCLAETVPLGSAVIQTNVHALLVFYTRFQSALLNLCLIPAHRDHAKALFSLICRYFRLHLSCFQRPSGGMHRNCGGVFVFLAIKLDWIQEKREGETYLWCCIHLHAFLCFYLFIAFCLLRTGGRRWKPWKKGTRILLHLTSWIRKSTPNKMVRWLCWNLIRAQFSKSIATQIKIKW